MPIRIRLDVLLAERKMKLNTLSEKVGITVPNLSILKNEKAKAVKLSTLEGLCRALDCQPGDLLHYDPEPENGEVDSPDDAPGSDRH
ncbi:MAG: helix-turn-helix transcriptional regulator [Verrucomicrobiales bacterium]